MSRTRLTEPTDRGVVRLLRLENRVGTASKFYTPIVEEDPAVPGAFRCRAEYGRIGGHVSNTIKATGSALTCERALEDLAREKQRGGYAIVLDRRGTTGAEPSAAPTKEPPAESAPAGRSSAAEDLGDLLEQRKRQAIWAF